MPQDRLLFFGWPEGPPASRWSTVGAVYASKRGILDDDSTLVLLLTLNSDYYLLANH